MKQLWVEQYRPKSKEDYVFKDDKQRKQIDKWISSGALPHMLLSGSPGTGKCLAPNTLINVRTVANVGHVMPISANRVPIIELFQVFGATNAEYETPVFIDNVEIETPTGFQKVIALVRKRAKAGKYTFTDGTETYTLTCSTRHLLIDEYGNQIYAENATTVKTRTGVAKLVSSEVLGDMDLYDVALDAPHLYYTADGLLHHNTTLAKMLLHELGIDNFDILEVNASKDNGVDFIRETITRFAETMGVGDMKYVLLDESDYLSPAAQAVLRNTMERYSDTVRFILTCNYPHKVIPAIKSRAEAGRMHIDRLDKDEFTLRLCNILIEESVQFDVDTVDQIVAKTYPDLRRGISMLQSCAFNGVLELPEEDSSTESDYKIDMVALFRAGRYREARELVCKQAAPEEYEDIYRFMYENVEIWGENEDTQNRCILAIRDGLVKHTSVADIEINLSATLIDLELIARGLV